MTAFDLARYQEQLSRLYPHERENLRLMFSEADRMFSQVARFICSSMPFLVKMVSMPFTIVSMADFHQV